MYIFYLVYFCVQHPKFTLAFKQAKGNCCRFRQLDKGPQESMFVSVCERDIIWRRATDAFNPSDY